MYQDDEFNTSESMFSTAQSLVGYVKDKKDEWENHIETTYRARWEEYDRIFRGRWSSQDKTKEDERSRMIAPATSQAVESIVCDIEEATFGQKYFDIIDDPRDPNGEDVELLKNLLTEEMYRNKVRSAVSVCLLQAAVTGTGVAEIVTQEVPRRRMGKKPMMEGAVMAHGVYTENAVSVHLRPVLTKNFYPDPTATSIEEGHGCVIEEFVGEHAVKALQESGVYLNNPVGSGGHIDSRKNPDSELPVTQDDLSRVLITKYFGLVPKSYLDMANMSDEEYEDYAAELQSEQVEEDMSLVEAIVILGNEGVLLKAESNPYMMQDRPVVAFPWDPVPGLLHGRGVVEKAYNSQKSLDAELRARQDALALTIHPMMGMDATRIPRGHKPTVKAGKTILTNGNPQDVLKPFTFGQVDQITFAQAAEMQGMVQQSTGAIDSGFAQGMGSNNKTGATSMALGSIIKRHKRTLLNFQEGFWLPTVEKMAWRYMQFDAESFPIKDFRFTPTSTLGIMAREYEVSQLIQLLQTTSDKSPLYPAIVQSIVDKMNIENREELKNVLEEAAQVSPEEQERAREMHQIDKQHKIGVTKYAHAQALESTERAGKYRAEAEAVPKELEISKLEAVTRNLQPGVQDDNAFTKRLAVSEFALKEKEQNRKDRELEANIRLRRELAATQEPTDSVTGASDE